MASLFPPQRMCAQIDDSLIAQFLGYWISYGKPCSLTIHASKKSPSLVGVCFTADPEDIDTMTFMEKAVSRTGAKSWNITKEEKK